MKRLAKNILKINDLYGEAWNEAITQLAFRYSNELEEMAQNNNILFDENGYIVEDIEDTNDLTEKDQFIKKCENSGKFNDYQITQIVEGLEGLTIDQVKVYADPKFSDKQMYQICTGFEDGLSMKQIKVFARPEFDWKQMEMIRIDFKHGLTIEKVKEKYHL